MRISYNFQDHVVNLHALIEMSKDGDRSIKFQYGYIKRYWHFDTENDRDWAYKKLTAIITFKTEHLSTIDLNDILYGTEKK